MLTFIYQFYFVCFNMILAMVKTESIKTLHSRQKNPLNYPLTTSQLTILSQDYYEDSALSTKKSQTSKSDILVTNLYSSIQDDSTSSISYTEDLSEETEKYSNTQESFETDQIWRPTKSNDILGHTVKKINTSRVTKEVQLNKKSGKDDEYFDEPFFRPTKGTITYTSSNTSKQIVNETFLKFLSIHAFKDLSGSTSFPEFETNLEVIPKKSHYSSQVTTNFSQIFLTPRRSFKPDIPRLIDAPADVKSILHLFNKTGKKNFTPNQYSKFSNNQTLLLDHSQTLPPQVTILILVPKQYAHLKPVISMHDSNDKNYMPMDKPSLRKDKPIKCYTCGLESMNLSDTFCFEAFAPPPYRPETLRKQFKTKCDEAESYKGGCFKRFVDVGKIYYERGCRTLPPKRGKSFASKRLAKIEFLLKNKEKGCVISPFASLTPFSRAISLYVRYHVCVCQGKYCNKSTMNEMHGFLGTFLLTISACLIFY